MIYTICLTYKDSYTSWHSTPDFQSPDDLYCFAHNFLINDKSCVLMEFFTSDGRLDYIKERVYSIGIDFALENLSKAFRSSALSAEEFSKVFKNVK